MNATPISTRKARRKAKFLLAKYLLPINNELLLGKTSKETDMVYDVKRRKSENLHTYILLIGGIRH